MGWINFESEDKLVHPYNTIVKTYLKQAGRTNAKFQCGYAEGCGGWWRATIEYKDEFGVIEFCYHGVSGDGVTPGLEPRVPKEKPRVIQGIRTTIVWFDMEKPANQQPWSDIFPEGTNVNDLPARIRRRLEYASERGSPWCKDTLTGAFYLGNYLWNGPNAPKNLPWGQYMTDDDVEND